MNSDHVQEYFDARIFPMTRHFLRFVVPRSTAVFMVPMAASSSMPSTEVRATITCRMRLPSS